MNRESLRLYLVTDRLLAGDRPLEIVVAEAIRGGVTMVQVREKHCTTREFLQIAENIHNVCREHGVPMIVNDRVDIALAVDAEGVHLGQNDMPVSAARRILGRKKIIGLSVESIADALVAEREDVDYLGVSPIFFTPTKTDLQQELGIDGLKKIKSFSRHPLVAIGGLNAGNAADVMAAGADGLAVVSAICAAQDPRAAAAELCDIIRKVKENAK